MTTLSSSPTVLATWAQITQYDERGPDQVDRPAGLPGQDAVDEQLQHGQHACPGPRRPTAGPGSRRTRWPPTNIRATPLSSQAATVPTTPERRTSAEAAQQGRAPAPTAVDIDGNATHHHELGEEQHRLDEDQAAGVQARLVGVEHVAGDDMSTLERAKKANSACELRDGLAEHRPAAVLAVRVSARGPSAGPAGPASRRPSARRTRSPRPAWP